jgi:hypothetical protein
MTYYLSSDTKTTSEGRVAAPVADPPSSPEMADLRIFWGPEICRLEYLLHLLDTGRVKDEGA